MRSIFLYLSAFIPMYALLTLQVLIEIINGNLHFNVLNSISISVFCIAIILGTIGLILTLKEKPKKQTEVLVLSSVNITDQHFFAYISIFILFTLTFDISKVSMFITTIIILVLIGVVYIHNKIFYINPLLNILGYSFYEITYKTTPNSSPKTAMVFYKGHKNLNGKKVKVNLESTNFCFIDIKKQGK